MTLSSRLVRKLLLLFTAIVVLALHSSGQTPSFSHVWKYWGGDWQPIDTALLVEQAFAQEPLLEDWWGVLPIGNQGSWRQQLIPQAIPIPETHFGNRAFRDHFRNPKQWKFYHVRSPLTEADYRQGYARGQLFQIFHTQNVHERLNFYFEFNRLNSLGPYQNQQVEQSDVLLTMHYNSINGRYAFRGGFNTAFIQAESNGGLFFDSVFTENSITDRSLILVNSQNGLHYLRNRTGDFHQSFRIINRENDSTYNGWLQKLQLNHSFSYLRQSMVYTDIPGFTTPDPILQSFQTNDSTAFERVENSLGFSMEGAFQVGASLWLSSSSNEGVNYRTVQNHTGLRAHFETNVLDKFPIRAQWNYIISGPRQGGLDLYAETGFQNGTFEFLPYAQLTRAFPGFQEYRYTSNYRAWNNTYEIMTRTEFGLKLKQKWLGELKLSAFQWSSPVYFDSLAFPVQANSSSGYVSLSWHSAHKWWIFRLDNRMILQITDDLDPFLQVPDFYFRETLYSQFYLFGKAVQLQPGITATWFSAFNMPAYDAYANVFHLQRSQTIGGYPLLDAFLNVRLGKATFIFELEHFNNFLSGYDYWAAPGYPLPDMQFRMGLVWRFFN